MIAVLNHLDSEAVRDRERSKMKGHRTVGWTRSRY